MKTNRTRPFTRRALSFALVLASSTVLLQLSSRAATRVVVWGCPDCGGGYSAVTNVPANATNWIALTVGDEHGLGLTADGSLAAWGDNFDGGARVPTSVTNVVTFAAGAGFNIALKTDGRVIPWGGDTSGPLTNVPPSATNLVAIDAYAYHRLALRADGSVVTWGAAYPPNVPMPLVDDAVAIASGEDHALVLKGDGTVVGWGQGYSGDATPPPGLANVIAIGAGEYSSLALKADGQVVYWGYDYGGLASVPAEATNVVAIAAGRGLNAALRADGTVVTWGAGLVPPPPPGLSNVVAISAENNQIAALLRNDSSLWFSHRHVPDRIAYAGRETRFIVTAFGAGPLSYQWRHDGVDIAGATNAVLPLHQLQPADAGTYSVRISDRATSVSTNVANLLVSTELKIAVHPQSRTLPEGFPVSFQVVPGGAGPVWYQWRHDGTDVPDATNAVLELPSISAGDAGRYEVIVSNPYSSLTSQPAILTVQPVDLPAVGRFSSDFASGLPSQTALFGSAALGVGAGPGQNPVLKLVLPGENGFGDFVIDNFSGPVPVTAFIATFDVLLGGGADIPADGFSFNFTTNFPSPPAYGNPSEEGMTNGLSICFDTWDNITVDHGPVMGTDDTAPAIDAKVDGRPIAFQSMAGFRSQRSTNPAAPAGPLLIDPQTGQALALETEPSSRNGPTLTHFAPVTIELKVDGTLWVTYKGVLVLSNVQTRLPPLAGAKFGFGGRTGESFENIWIDNLGIQTYSAPRPLVFATDAPTNLWVFEGQPATFRADLFGSEPIFIQWFSNNVAIAGATNSIHTTPPATLANNGDIYRIDASNAVNSISRSAMLGIQPVVFLTAGPTNQVVRTNQTATFRADLYGSPPIRIQWFSNNVAILNATNSAYTTPPAIGENDGDVYRIEASNSFSSTNRSATLTVLLQPVIVQHPQSQTNFAGANVTFTVVVTNNATLPITYSWRKISTILTNITLNARTGSFTLYNVQTNVTATSGPGNYRVAVMNAANPTGLPSSFATLTVLSAPRLQLSASQVGTSFQLTATGTTNTNWRIESRETVAGSNAWQPLTNITLGPSPAIIQQPFTSTNHFYRGARLP